MTEQINSIVAKEVAARGYTKMIFDTERCEESSNDSDNVFEIYVGFEDKLFDSGILRFPSSSYLFTVDIKRGVSFDGGISLDHNYKGKGIGRCFFRKTGNS